MGAFLRLYTFLSQIFDYGNTDLEKRSIFFKRLLPLLEFGREREGIDISKVVLTHHHLKNRGQQPMILGEGERPTLEPITEGGQRQRAGEGEGQAGRAHRQVERPLLRRLDGSGPTGLCERTSSRGSCWSRRRFASKRANNTKEQFGNSPDLDTKLLHAIMGALDAHNQMSTQALNSPVVRNGIKNILLNYAGLWESLRDRVAV